MSSMTIKGGGDMDPLEVGAVHQAMSQGNTHGDSDCRDARNT